MPNNHSPGCKQSGLSYTINSTEYVEKIIGQQKVLCRQGGLLVETKPVCPDPPSVTGGLGLLGVIVKKFHQVFCGVPDISRPS